MIDWKTNVAYTQAKGCRLCVHVGSLAIFFGRTAGRSARLELLTPRRWFRFSLLCLALVAFPGAAQSSYPHGFKLTHDSNGVAYTGGYYSFDAYRCKWLWVAYPKAGSVSHDNHSITVNYAYTYNNASANAGTSQGGLQGAFRYDQYDVGRDEIDTQHYVAASHAIDEKRLANQHVRDVQAGYTQSKLLELQTIQAKAQLLKSLDSSPPAPQVLQQFNSYTPATSKGDKPTNLAGTEAKCQRCHNAGAAEGLGGGNVLPAFSEFSAEQAKAGFRYVTKLTDNCATKAQLSSEEQQELASYFCRKAAQ